MQKDAKSHHENVSIICFFQEHNDALLSSQTKLRFNLAVSNLHSCPWSSTAALVGLTRYLTITIGALTD